MKKDQKVPVFNQYETVSPATKLLEKRRKMYEIHEAFEAEKEEFREKEVNFQEEEEKIKTKDKEFQIEMTKFCQFSQQNEAKKKKAEERARFQQRAYLEKEQQIKNLEKEIEQLTKNQKRYQNKVAHFRKYEQYLQKVRTAYSDQYPEMTDILNRHQILKNAFNDLNESRKKIEHDYQSLKKQFMNEEKELNQSILTISNETKELSRRTEERLKQKNEIQAEVERSNEQFSNKNLNLDKIFMAIDNLHFRCNENSFKLKHDFDEKSLAEKKEFKATKKIESEGMVINGGKNEDDVSFDQKSKAASSKLKAIVSHMKDFKAIIDQYKISKQQKV